ncbi:trypsin-1-like [Wyeomyia smithii]|uniref:trypsin-1-like n=1 Tax=Wyeomyia smithii TaxID=174621 RepID=UPI00246817EF|nr:trypsin-1-like [Wyeomyia smithii]
MKGLLVTIVLSLFLALVTAQEPKIYNGFDVHIRDRPYQVAIFLLGQFNCGGTLIGDRWILTAAHCVRRRFSGDIFASELTVRIGSHFLRRGGHLIRVTDVIKHPEYDEISGDCDYALIELEYPYSIDPIARPVEMIDENETIAEGTLCTASGWGKTMGTGNRNLLKMIELPLLNWFECNQALDDLGFSFTENQMCTRYEKQIRSLLQGDSGGPLICNRKLAGIASSGTGRSFSRVTARPPAAWPAVSKRVKPHAISDFCVCILRTDPSDPSHGYEDGCPVLAYGVQTVYIQ